MDLPPPPPIFGRHHRHPHLRYEHVLHPPDFIPPPYLHHLPPPPPPPPPLPLPPQTLPRHMLLPPPPPPPPLPLSRHSPFPPRFTFSPPRRPIIERSRVDDFGPLPKPYYDRTFITPPPPLENIPFRVIHDYPDRNPITRNEIFYRDCVDNRIYEFPEIRDRNLELSARELYTRVPDIEIGEHNRRRDAFHQSRELCMNRDGSERWGSGTSDWGRDLYNRRDFDERRWNNGLHDQGRELYIDRDYDESRWDNGINARKLYCDGVDDERILDPRSNGVFSQFEDSHTEFLENDLSLGPLCRFIGRLGKGESEGEVMRPDKKMSVLHRIQVGKDCSSPSRGYKRRHFPKRLTRGSFKGKKKEIERLQTRMEDKREREQSPVELAISFKSNTLVARAILTPSHPDVESDVKSTSMNKRLVYNMPKSPPATYSGDVVLDLQSDLQETSKVEDKASGDVVLDLQSGGMDSEIADTSTKSYSPSGHKLKRKRVSLTTTSASSGEAENLISVCSSHAQRPETNTVDADPTLQSGDTDSEIADTSIKSYSPFGHKLKRKRVSLTTTSASSGEAENLISVCSSHAQRLETTTVDADPAHQLGADLVPCPAHEKSLANKIASNDGDILGVNEQMHDNAAVLECSFVNCPSELTLPSEAHDVSGSSRSQEIRIVAVHEDKHVSENHELISSPMFDCALKVMQIPEDVPIFGAGSKDANSKDVFLDQVVVPQAGVDAMNSRSSGCDAVADCSNVGLGPCVSSCFLLTDYNGILPKFDISGANLSPNIDSAKGSPELISDGETCLSVDCSPKIIRKRKTRGAQLGVSCTKTNDSAGTVMSVDGEIARGLAVDVVSAVEVDFLGEKNSCKDSDEGPSRVDEVIPENDATGFFTGFQKKPTLSKDSSLTVKKQKLSSSTLSHSSLFEDDTCADGQTTNLQILDQQFSRLVEMIAEPREDTSSSFTAINQCGTLDVDSTFGIENSLTVNLDENLYNGYKVHGNNDVASIASSSFCTEGNDDYSSDSSDELLVSSFDMRSYMSSPEQLRAYSDLSFPRKTEASACLSENGMICASVNISKKKSLSGDPDSPCLGKSLVAAANILKTNAGIPPLQRGSTTQVLKKLNPVSGKLTWSRNQLTSDVRKVIPGPHPSNFSNSKKLYPIPATKSRTWHRTGNSSVVVAEPNLNSSPVLQSNVIKAAKTTQSSYVRKGNSLVRNSSVSVAAPPIHGSSCPVYRRTPSPLAVKTSQVSGCQAVDGGATTLSRIEQVNSSKLIKTLGTYQGEKSLSCGPCKTVCAPEERIRTNTLLISQKDPVINSDSHSALGDGKSKKKIKYFKRRSNQLVAASNSDGSSGLRVDKSQASLSDGYYKSKQNQIVRASTGTHVERGEANGNAPKLVPHSVIPKNYSKRQSGFFKTCRRSKFPLVWKLHDAQCSEKEKISSGPQKVWPHFYSSRRSASWRSFILGRKLNTVLSSNISQKLLLSRRRGAIYTRSTHGYSLKMSKVLSVGGSSLKWSKSIERNAKKANEDATRAVAAAEKRKKEEKGAAPIASKSRNHVSRKLVTSVRLRPGERIFRIGSERYKMDPTRRALYRITAEKESSSSVAHQSEKNVKRSYIPRRLLIGNEEYVRIGNGNQLVRDPKKRTRVLASEKVRWSLRTARLRLARKRRFCQFFTRFGKCNKDDGKCPYIHDPSKIVVCTKFLSGSCCNPDCKLTHKVIPERMQDCSYYLKGSCSNENCPYRHVSVDPDSTVCESFLRGYCADGNECRKKHTYVCPAFETNGICPQGSMCKLHHPKKKVEKKPTSEQNIVRGRYFDGGLVEFAECSEATTDKRSAKGKVDIDEGKYPDYISLDVSDDEVD